MTFARKHKHARQEPAADTPAPSPEAGIPAEAPTAAEAAPAAAPASAEAPAAPVAETPPAAPSEAEQLKDRLLRLQADFDNYRKRMAREQLEYRLRACQDVLEALLTPFDHLNRALGTLRQSVAEDDALLQGVALVRAEFKAVFERFGLQPVEALGKRFDPTFHEALGHAPTQNLPEGHVAAELRAGYLLNGRVLRAAQVLVATPPPAESAPEKASAPGESPPEKAEG